MSTPIVADIQVQASLSEHYLYTQDAPIAPGPLNRFVSVFDGQVSHLLTVDSSGQMLHFMPDQTSQSGWNVTQVNVPPPPNGSNMWSIDAFFTAGQLNAIVLFEAAGGYGMTWISRNSAGSWGSVDYDNSDYVNTIVSQMGSYTDGDGNTWVYGVGAPGIYFSSFQFFVLCFNESLGRWTTAYLGPVSELTNSDGPGEFRIVSKPRDPNYNCQLVWMHPDGTGTTFAAALAKSDSGQFTLSPSESWGSIRESSLKQPRFVRISGQFLPGYVLVLDESDDLYLGILQSPSGGFVKLNAKDAPPNIAAVSLSQVSGTATQLALFAIEAGTNSLWIARDNPNDPFFFGNWANLGTYAGVIAAPEIVQGGAEIYFADSALNVHHLAQNPTDGIWATRKLAAPIASANSPQKTSAIMMHVTVVDSNGNPVPNASVEVAADQWSNIVSNELCYMSGPGGTVLLQADATGSVDISYDTTSLAMPIFTLTSGSAQNLCQGDVVLKTTTPVSLSSIANRLANNDPSHPINQTTLESLNLVAPGTDPTPYIQAITQLGQAMLPQQSSPSRAGLRLSSLDLRSVTIPHWRIDFTKGGATFRTLTAGEANLLRESSSAGRPAAQLAETRLGSFISDAFGDAVNFFSNAASAVTSVAVSIADDALNVAMNGVVYVVTTARQIAAVIQMIFAKLAEGLADIYTVIKEVIQFLEMLFHWADVLATHRVFKACINSFFNTAETCVEDIKPLVHAQVSYLQQNLAATITQLQQQIGSQTFNEYANSISSAGSLRGASDSNFLSASAAQVAYEQTLSRCWYIYNKAKNHLDLSSSPEASSSTVDLTPLLTQVANSWGSSAVNFSQQVQQIVNSLPQGFGSFKDLFDLGMIDLLQLTQDFAQLLLSGLEAIVMAVLDLIDAALKGFQSMINSSIDIPVISWLYKYAITGTPIDPGDDLTILDLLCLISAVPVTIIYKILEGGAPFSSSDADYFEQNGLAWPTGSIPGRTPSAARMTSLTAASIPASAYMALGLCGAVLYLWVGALGLAVDGLAFMEDPPKPAAAVVSFAACVGGALRTTLVAPWSLWIAGESSWAYPDWSRTALWCFAAYAAVTDATFVFVTKALPAFGANLPEFPTAGPILAGGIGTVLLAAGFVVFGLELGSTLKGSQKYSVADMLNTFVPQAIRVPKFLITLKDNDEIAPFALGALLGCDALLAAGSSATQASASVGDWKKSGARSIERTQAAASTAL